MKYTVKLESTIDVPDDTVYILYYQKKTGERSFYPIKKILSHNGRYMRAEILGKGPRTFINEKILSLNHIEN